MPRNLDLPLIGIVAAALVVALVVALVATPVVKNLAIRVKAVDVPKDGRRMHDHPIPRMGGLAIFLGFLLSVLLFLDLNAQMRGMLLGAVIIVVLGIFDDIYSLRAMFKFVVQIIAALVAVLSGNVIETLSNPNVFSADPYWNLGILAVPATVIWIVAITNAVNLIDGLDGLACGVSTISSMTLLVIALVVSEGNVAILMAALAGGCIGFLPYNMNPAKIFMGDTGSLFLGGAVCGMAFALDLPLILILVGIIYIVETLSDIIQIVYFKATHGKRIFRMAPLHHHLEMGGWSEKKVVFVFAGISLVFCILAFFGVIGRFPVL